jgi:hypothetical protein
MSTRLSLDTISVASPCTVSWDAMRGDGRVRFCTQCNQKVYNLSEMPHKQAEALLRQSEGKMCARFYRRRDGTVMTADCPIGLRAIRRRLTLVIGGVAAAWLFVAGAGLSLGGVVLGIRAQNAPPVAPPKPGFIQALQDFIYPPQTGIMGDICPTNVPPPPPTNVPPPPPANGQHPPDLPQG